MMLNVPKMIRYNNMWMLLREKTQVSYGNLKVVYDVINGNSTGPAVERFMSRYILDKIIYASYTPTKRPSRYFVKRGALPEVEEWVLHKNDQVHVIKGEVGTIEILVEHYD